MTEQEQTASVLVGIDGTDSGLEALSLGRMLAEALSAPMTLAAVYGHEVSGPGELVWPPRHQANEWLVEAERLAGTATPSSSRVFLASSAPHGLIELAELTEADVLALGSTRRGGFGRVLAGSTAVRTLQGAPCPVAVAPRGWRRPDRLHVIGAAVNDAPESRAALVAAGRLAQATGARLRVLAVVTPPSPAHPMFAAPDSVYADWVQSLREHAGQTARHAIDALPKAVEADIQVLEGGAVPRLEEATEHFDLLVVGSRRYGPLRRVLLGSVSAPLLERAACPLLVMPRGVNPPLAEPAQAVGAAGER